MLKGVSGLMCSMAGLFFAGDVVGVLAFAVLVAEVAPSRSCRWLAGATVVDVRGEVGGVTICGTCSFEVFRSSRDLPVVCNTVFLSEDLRLFRAPCESNTSARAEPRRAGGSSCS